MKTFPRLCRARLEGFCPGHNKGHCEPHEPTPGCQMSWCDGEQVGHCQIYSGEIFGTEPEFFDVYQPPSTATSDERSE